MPTSTATRDLHLSLLRTMLRIRHFEILAEKLFLEGRLPGFVHVSIGQEATATGACSALRKDDFITSTHRGHGHALAKGADARGMMAELFGKEEGLCHGRGGSMHIADFRVGMLGANGVVAGGLGIACGAGLSAQLRGSDAVTVSFFGDGAVARGPFHEALNMASVWRLPVVFLCESNGWASTMRTREVIAGPIAAKAAAYDMPGIAVDGDDVLAVRSALTEAVERARVGGGPTLVEARTLRWRGHYVGDPMKYRSPSEKARPAAGDPIDRAAATFIELGTVSAAEVESIGRTAEAEMQQLVTDCEALPTPDPADVRRYVLQEASA